MGLKFFSILALHCLVFLLSSFRVRSQVSVQFLSAPLALSNRNSADFTFRVLLGSNDSAAVVCTDCSTNCKVGFLLHSVLLFTEQRFCLIPVFHVLGCFLIP